MKNKQILKRSAVATLFTSIFAMMGCQSTGQQVTETKQQNVMTRTQEVDISPNYIEPLGFNFVINEPMQFDLALSDVVNCGFSGSSLDGKRGTLYITKVRSYAKNFKPHDEVLGYVSSDSVDISQCTANVERTNIFGKTVGFTEGYATTVIPKFKELVAYHKDEQRRNKEKQKLEAEKKARADQLAQWHIRELSDTAQGIATIKVCMEKGTFFLPGDKRAQKVLRESESYARNDIKSKVNGKHYWDQQAYAQAHQKGLNKARYLWQHDYLTFSNQCAAMRNTVDSLTNK
ncbi:hypothetical protein CKF94_17950 [Vibrio coralliilyticus]|uniref:hypothetical protein n=1 Tax=Vibrio coralliilyticus TaxID=190893 RepID=UPI000BAAF8F9|nr:hypothetical protein [Vibrio coralliilyticus]PAU36859.1 hypothetical protein CKF94_17950 [Vibrio coralliilyticus]